MDLPWTFIKLVNDFPAESIVELLDKQELLRKQTPPMMAALYSQKDILSAFMNFYASKIGLSEFCLRNCKNRKNTDLAKVCRRECNICIVKRLLHRKDKFDKTLTSYIVTANEKSLSAMGIVLEFEHDFHIRNKKDLLNKDKNDPEECEESDYLELQACLQKNVGTSFHSDQVLNLMESTRTPSTSSVWLKIAIAVLTVHLLQFGLHVGDITSDANVAQNYFTNWKNGTTNPLTASKYEGTNNMTEHLQDYPNELGYQNRFLYTMFSMIAPIIFYSIEMWRHYGVEIWREHSKTHAFQLLALICVCILLSPILAVFWPLIIFIWRIFPLAHYELSQSGEKQQEYKDKLEKISQMALVVQLFEVCLESSFQAILQWYEIFPTFIGRLDEILNSDGDGKSMVVSVETNSISFIFSIVSLVWSFTSYSAAQKHGVLDITRNLLARSILFLSNLFLIFSRVNSLVLFMYYCGKGQFYPGMIWVLGHIVIMMVVHLNTLHDSGKLRFQERTDDEEKVAKVYGKKWQSITRGVKEKGDQPESTERNKVESSQSLSLGFYMEFSMAVFYVCLLNGLANVFINNFIDIPMNKFKNLGKKKGKTFSRQLVVDMIFLVHSIFMVSCGLTVNAHPINNSTTGWYLGFIIMSCHIIGLVLKVVYYKYFHIWKDMTVRVTLKDRRLGLKRGNEKKHIYLCNSKKEPTTEKVKDDPLCAATKEMVISAMEKGIIREKIPEVTGRRIVSEPKAFLGAQEKTKFYRTAISIIEQ
jgi:hypothetical protein